MSNLLIVKNVVQRTAVAPDARARIRRRIRELLERRGQTNRAFGKWMGHGDQWVSNLLAGRFPLAIDELDRAAAFLNVPPSELVRLVDDAWELSPSEQRVVGALRMLPPPVRDHLVLLADYLIGVTPDEVEYLAKLRKLSAEHKGLIGHWTDALLLKQGHVQVVPDHVVLPPGVAAPARRVRRSRSGDARET